MRQEEGAKPGPQATRSAAEAAIPLTCSVLPLVNTSPGTKMKVCRMMDAKRAVGASHIV